MANDNAPSDDVPRGDAVGFNAMLRERQNPHIFGAAQATKGPSYGFWFSLLIWVGFMSGLAWSFYTSQSVGLRIFCAIGLVWSGLWTRFLSVDHNFPRLAELSLLTTLIAFVALMLTATTQLGYPLTLAGGLSLFIGAALFVSWLNRSHIALIAAISAGLVWAALQMDGYVDSGPYALVIPALWAGLILQALRLKSNIALTASIVISYLWLVGSAMMAFNAGHLTALYLSAAAVIIGTLHYRGAKAAEDEGMAATSAHIMIGWTIAMSGLIGLANYAVNPLQLIWVDGQIMTPAVRIIWLAVMTFALIAIYVSGLVRRKHKRMSLAGVSLTTLLLACIPLGLWFEDALIDAFTQTTNLPLYPQIGIFLFGVIAGNILFFIANSFRRARFYQIIAALIMTCVMANFGQGLELQHIENGFVWALGFLGAIIVTFLALEPQLEARTNNDENKVSSR